MLSTRFGHQTFTSLANYPLALLFGVGAALTLLGALRGTLVPQLIHTMRLPGFGGGDTAVQLGSVTVATLTILTLFSMTYTTSPQSTVLSRAGRSVGRGLVLAAFGVFFAAAITTYVAALVGQLSGIVAWIQQLVGGA